MSEYDRFSPDFGTARSPRRQSSLYDSPAYRQPLRRAPDRSKVAAALLAFFLGGLGAHSFYRHRWGSALGRLGLCVTVLLILFNGARESIGLAQFLAVVNNLWCWVDLIIILCTREEDRGGHLTGLRP